MGEELGDRIASAVGVGFNFIISGSLLAFVCGDAEVRNTCGSNERFEDAGFILIYIGVSIIGVIMLLGGCLGCFVMCETYTENNNNRERESRIGRNTVPPIPPSSTN